MIIVTGLLTNTTEPTTERRRIALSQNRRPRQRKPIHRLSLPLLIVRALATQKRKTHNPKKHPLQEHKRRHKRKSHKHDPRELTVRLYRELAIRNPLAKA